ncbi:MAG: ATP-dependent DNA helicase, partial [Clostridia bacterium]|nr:ATP-dependent DNA helicase [Clostridia bacterium]
MPRKKKKAEAEPAELQGNAPESAQAPRFKVSVRSLVAFSVQDDESWSFTSYRLMQEGSLAHAHLQAKHCESGDYTSEVALSYSYETPECTLEINGRADGVWRLSDKVIVHEIKTSATPLSEIEEDFSDAHWAQGKCYAFILANQESLSEIWVRLTYYDMANDQEKSFDQRFTFERLQRFFKGLLLPYAGWAVAQEKWRQLRNLSIQTLSFPYSNYRKGQKLLAYNTYKSIEDGKRLFAQAPTGTGKTMGVLYPGIKALGEGKLDRIFYVTAKTTTRGIAENAYKLLANQGLRLKVLTLTAKDKMCLNTVKNCNPEKCLYIQGFIARSRKVVKELLKKNDFFSREKISEAGLRHGVCPFELSLELALSCDLIIADYNYVFDPRVYLRRFFEQKGREEYLILVDEAHNLFDRAREMYSASLSARTLADLNKELRADLPDIYKAIKEIKKAMTSLEKQYGNDYLEAGGVKYHALAEAPIQLKKSLFNFITTTESWLLGEPEEKPYSDQLVTLFFDLLHFKNILELYSDKYRTLTTGTKNNFQITLLCLDPRTMLDRSMNAARSTILFSATLSPLWYFKNILGGRNEDITLRLPSPFPKENLLLINEDRVETRFRHRERYLEAAAKAIHEWVLGHKGNT